MVFPLLQLPLEIRLQIYAYYLTSPTGYVRVPQQHHRRQRRCKIIVWDPEIQSGAEVSSTRPDHLAETDTHFVMPDVDLTILRVSKQVFQECKGIFLARNVVGFEEEHEVFSLKRIHQGLSKNIQHLILPFEVNFVRQTAVKCLEFLRDWSRTGSLKSLTLIATYSSGRTAVDILLGLPGTLGSDYPWYLALLRQTTHEGWFSHLQRNIVVYSGHRKAIRVLGQHDKAPPLERKFLQDLGDAFGANVWRDELLCFRNGVEVQGAFSADPVAKAQSPGKYEEWDTGSALESSGDLSQAFAP